MRPLELVHHRERELLRAGDLDRAVAAEAARRALHLRAVHRTWGVAFGFSVGVGRSGLGAVVGPGLGYARDGSEIASSTTVLVPAPTGDGLHDLAVSTRCGLEWRWREPGRVCDDELLLARFACSAGSLGEPDTAVRRTCRRPRFRLAAGSATVAAGPSATVSTAGGGFTATPFYFATLELTGLQRNELGPFAEIRLPTPGDFTLVLRAEEAWWRGEQPDVVVHWIGVEPLPAAPAPAPDPAAAASPLDLPDEYATFAAVPPPTPPNPA